MSFVGEHLSHIDAWVFVAPLHVFPWKESGFFIGFGPGFEHKSRRPSEGSEEGGHGALGLAYRSTENEATSETESEQGEGLFLWRTGIGYKIELGGGWAIAPALDWDIVREHGKWVNAIVFDVAIGMGF